MLLITLEPAGHDCRVELDGVDISRRVCRLELDADARGATLVRLTLIDGVVIAGRPGVLELQSQPRGEEPNAEKRDG
jgi:hypothetical protein